jgi:hypothetical protein
MNRVNYVRQTLHTGPRFLTGQTLAVDGGLGLG